MSSVLDRYTECFVDLWRQFRAEILPDLPHDPFLLETGWELTGPAETIDALWAAGVGKRELGSRGREVLARVRNWLRGAEQSALDDRSQVESLLERCSPQPAFREWH